MDITGVNGEDTDNRGDQKRERTPGKEERESDFVIPELPSGKVLRFELLSPWDDIKYMGLNAIEIFTQDGQVPDIEKIETDAEEAFGDVDNLLFCTTCPSTDPRGMWLCSYKEENLPIRIWMHFSRVETLALLRIWNYSESRVHALRGVHWMKVFLDDQCIFMGEISCAFSDMDGKPLGDTILFTTNEDILGAVSQNDSNFRGDEVRPTCSQMDLLSIEPIGSSTNVSANTSPLTDTSIRRPLTGGQASNDAGSTVAVARSPTNPRFSPGPNAPTVTIASCDSDERRSTTDDNLTDEEAFVDGFDDNQLTLIRGKLFHMELVDNWGYVDFIGLTGVQFLGANGEPIDTNGVIVRCSTEPQTSTSPSKLLNGRNLTIRPDDMWLTDFDPNEAPPMLSFNFPEEVELSGISIWNYNGSQDLACAGARCVRFYMNGQPIVNNTVLLRKAPGYLFFDYVQDVMFDRCHLFRPASSRPSTKSIGAFIFQIRLLSTYGDEFYIGLNGIELYNRRNHVIKLRPQNLAAFPESVNILPTVDKDPRSSEKLIDGCNDTTKPHHMWLTPMLPNSYARIFVIFDTPTFVSRIRIYNYRKTPDRGVRHVAISADDLIIYSGEVPRSSENHTGMLDVCLREIED